MIVKSEIVIWVAHLLGNVTGTISVLRTRFALDLGMGAMIEGMSEIDNIIFERC